MKTGDFYNNKSSVNYPELRWIEGLSHLMDSKFTLPGTRFKFGLDPLIGLIPVAGDIITFATSALLVLTMSKYGASREVMIRMALNVLLDSIIGAIPIIGRIFDFFLKANDRNLKLLKSHYHEGKYSGSGRWIIISFLIFSFLVVIGMGYLTVKTVSYLYHWVEGLL